MDPERRRHPRRDVLKTGTLFFADHRQCLDCLIWNLSEGGAMVEIEPQAIVADLGRLISEVLSLDRAYSVVWRDGRKLGVAFIF